jgi:hypothetical protein
MKTISGIFVTFALLLAGCLSEPTPAPPPNAESEPKMPLACPILPPEAPNLARANDPTANMQTPPKPVNVDELIKQLTTDDRQAAAVALASAGKRAVPALVNVLDDKDWQVRAAAVFALGQIGSDAAEAKDKLQTIAEKDENTSVRDAAAFALDAIAEKSTK